MQQNDKNEILRNNWIELLTIIYNRIPWFKIRTRHNPHDIFNHRVRAASRKENINQFVSKICNYFGLQSLSSDTIQYITELEKDREKALNLLYDEHIPICVMAIAKAKEIRELRKLRKDKEGEKNDDL